MSSFFRRIEITEPYSIFSTTKTLSLPFFYDDDGLDLTLDLLRPVPLDPFSAFDTITDLITTRRVDSLTRRVDSLSRYHLLQSLSDRVSALELTFDSLADRHVAEDRKYTWEAEIKHPERKYKLTAEIKKNKCGKVERDYKWRAEIKDGDDVSRSYTFKASSGSEKREKGDKKEKGEKKKKKGDVARVVEIEETTQPDHGAVVLKQVCV